MEAAPQLLALLRTAHRAVVLKQRQLGPVVRRAAYSQLHAKEFEDHHEAVADALQTHFAAQITDIQGRLAAMTERGGSYSQKTPEDGARAIVANIYDARAWDEGLRDAVMPPLAAGMRDAAASQLAVLGFDSQRMGHAITKDRNPAEVVSGLMRDMPAWMVNVVTTQLEEAFSQPYWTKINETTAADIQEFLRAGLTEGQSMREMARSITEAFPEEYSRRRAMTVARTETANALNGARRGSIDQVINDVPDLGMRATWLSVLSNTTRDEHASLDGVPADAEGLFNVAGTRVPWPGHFSLAAGQRVNCFPAGMLVAGDFVGAQRAWYEGIFTEIILRFGGRITVTPNHPVMTPIGFVRAGSIEPGDQIMTHLAEGDRPVFSVAGCNQVDDKPSLIEEVCESFFSRNASSGFVEIRRPNVNDFYGDGSSIYGDIEVVRPNRKLLDNRKLTQLDKEADQVLSLVLSDAAPEPGDRSLTAFLHCAGTAASSFPSFGQSLTDVFRALEISPSGPLSVGVATQSYSRLLQSTSKNWPTVTGLLRKSLQRSARFVSCDDVVEVRDFYSAGHIYDLESSNGLILACDPSHNTSRYIVTSNCQCSVVTEFGVPEEEAQQLIADHMSRQEAGHV